MAKTTKTSRPLFTICIPVYNTEKYIKYAIQDILAQTLGDFECLIIDDKSPDKATDIAEKMTAQDPRFKIFRQSRNRGVSATRNHGIKQARGEYIIFLDSDDRFSDQLLERIAQEIEKSKSTLDIIAWELGGVGENNEKINQLEPWREAEIAANPKPIGVYTPRKFADRLFQVGLSYTNNKCLRVNFIRQNKLTFDTGIKFGEDALFSYMATCLAKNIVAIARDNILYYYRRDQPLSATHRMDFPEQMHDRIAITLKLQSFLRGHNLLDVYADSFGKWAQNGVGAILHHIVDRSDKKLAWTSQRILDIKNSRSWRLTMPLRKIEQIIRGFKK